MKAFKLQRLELLRTDDGGCYVTYTMDNKEANRVFVDLKYFYEWLELIRAEEAQAEFKRVKQEYPF